MKNNYYKHKVLLSQTPLVDGNRDTIVKWIYDVHVVEWYATYLTHQTLEGNENLRDKIQEIYLMICEIPQKKWDKIYAQGFYAISAYVTGIVHQQLVSDSSVCYRKYNLYETKNKIMTEDFWRNYDEETKQ